MTIEDRKAKALAYICCIILYKLNNLKWIYFIVQKWNFALFANLIYKSEYSYCPQQNHLLLSEK